MIAPCLLSNDELERAARDRDDPLLQEAVRRLIDGEGEPDEAETLRAEIVDCEATIDRLERELSDLADLCTEAAGALREKDCDDRDLLKRLETA